VNWFETVAIDALLAMLVSVWTEDSPSLLGSRNRSAIRHRPTPMRPPTPRTSDRI
jgi:hypothetical protein